jgi:hypothetical protein
MESSTVQQYSLAQQSALTKKAKYELENPINLIVAQNKIGNKVQVNNEFTAFYNFQELKKFIFDRKTTIHTLSFFSNQNTTSYNTTFNNSQEHNIKIISLLQNMQILTNKISQETNPHIRNLLKLNYDTLTEQLDQKINYLKVTDKDVWVCRHMAFAYILDFFEIDIQKASIFFCSDEPKHLHEQIDLELTKICKVNDNIYIKLFAENLTIANLLASKNYLNSKNIFCLDDYINNVLSHLDNYSINTKLSDIGIQIKDILSSIERKETDSENAQIYHAIEILCYFYKSLLPMCNHSFHTGMLKYDLSYHSINSFSQYLQQQCYRFYYRCPVNYQEKYILVTKNHMMSFKITRKVETVEISFFDINHGFREIIFHITNGEYHREINLLNFIDLQALTTYKILEYDDYNLATMSCYRVNNLDGNL